MIEIGLRTWILSQTAIVSQLSGSGPHPVFIEEADPDCREYILLNLVSADFNQSLDLDDRAHRDLIDESIDVTVKCETAGKAREIGQAVLDQLFPQADDNFSGAMGNRVVEGLWLDSVSHAPEPPLHGESKGRHVMQISLQIHSRGAG